MKTAPAKNVEEYLNSFPERQRQTLEKVRNAIKTAAPGATESISYGLAGYKLGGPLVYFGGFKNHCSFFPASHSVMKMFEDELKPYETSRSTIHFPIVRPLPSTLVKKMVVARIKENAVRHSTKAKKEEPAARNGSHS